MHFNEAPKKNNECVAVCRSLEILFRLSCGAIVAELTWRGLKNNPGTLYSTIDNRTMGIMGSEHTRKSYL